MATRNPHDEPEIITMQGNKGESESLSLLDKLRAMPDTADSEEYVNPWMPTVPGDGLEGTVTAVGRYVDEMYGGKADGSALILRTYTIQEDNGMTWSIIPFHAKLRRELLVNRVDVGDRVAILYVDDKPSPSDPEMFYKDYRVARTSAGRIRRTARTDTGRSTD